MPVESDSAPAFRRAIALLALVLVFRVVYAAFFAVNPAGDEAYYWDWGRQLDYGYYSKPPMIAWIYAFVDWIGGGSLWAIRATAAFLGTLSLLLLYRLAADLFESRTAWIALLLALATPANSVLSFFLTIDAPLVLCWTTALWSLWRYVSHRGGAGSLLLLASALAAGHLCKQMMMLFPVIALIFLGAAPETRPLLRRAGLHLALFGSYLSLLPPLLWNARHDWITFRHTGHHFVDEKTGGGSVLIDRLGDFLSFLGTQLGVLSPGTAFVVFSLCLGGLPLLRRAPAPQRFLLAFGALPLGVMILLALRQGLQPNWAAVFYISGIVLAAAWYAGKIGATFPPASWRRLLPATLGVGFLLCAYFYAAPPLFRACGHEGHVADPARRLLGHDETAREFERLRRSLPDADSLVLVALGHRDLASQLAFGLPDQPRVYRWEPQGRVVSQYEIWNDPVEDGLAGRDALILAPQGIPPVFRRAFESIREVGQFTVSLGADRSRTFRVFLGENLKAWPGA